MYRVKEYKILKDVPLVRSVRFDPNIPEYVTMMKMKVGDAFEFPASRVKEVHNSKNYIKKNVNRDLCFVATSPKSIKEKKMKMGTCWRIKDGSTKNYGKRKERKKPGKGLTLHNNG